MELHPITLLPARERVASVLRDAILAKKFVSGESLTLEQVSGMLGVSKTPVREAFQILAHDGLIKLTPNKGAVVLGITAQGIADRYEVRAALECACVIKICENNADLHDIIYYHQRLVAISKGGDTRDNSLFNQQFHLAIWNAANNETMTELLKQLCSGLYLQRKAPSTEEVADASDHHENIVQALIRRDANAASWAMRSHIMHSMSQVISNPNKIVLE